MNEEYKELPITKGYKNNKTIIGYLKCDLDDYEYLKNHSIFLDHYGYPTISINRRNYKIHRIIISAKKGEYVDHIYHDKLDARKKNLRLVGNQENCSNKKGLSKSNKSGYRGVSQTRHGKWVATVGHNYKIYRCGTYNSPEDAAQAAANKRVELGYLDKGITPESKPIEHKKNVQISTTGYKGIDICTKTGKYRVRIWIKSKEKYCGMFDTLEKAIKARDKAMREKEKL